MELSETIMVVFCSAWHWIQLDQLIEIIHCIKAYMYKEREKQRKKKREEDVHICIFHLSSFNVEFIEIMQDGAHVKICYL